MCLSEYFNWKTFSFIILSLAICVWDPIPRSVRAVLVDATLLHRGVSGESLPWATPPPPCLNP